MTAEKIEGVFDDDTERTMKEYVAIADQLAGILVGADNIKGNPRLIKRLLNALEIRKMCIRDRYCSTWRLQIWSSKKQ